MDQDSSPFVHTLHKSKQPPEFRFAPKAIFTIADDGSRVALSLPSTLRLSDKMHVFSGLG